MAQAVQVEIRSGTTHTLTWVNAVLRPRVGMGLVCKGDPRSWEVVHAYSNSPLEYNVSDWKET